MSSQVASTAASTLLLRRAARRSLAAWSRVCGFEPARHHQFIIDKLEAVARGEIKRLMIFLPPGSAKSTYSSVLFPPWMLGFNPNSAVLACSHSADLATHFGRRIRNLILDNDKVLGYSLRSDSQAADEWGTTNGSEYFCAGAGGRIAGRRADLGLIDDPVGSKEDAYSKQMRDKVWDWYRFDFMRRLKPGAAIVLIQTRWHEDDLAGRLLSKEYGGNPEEWEVIKIPLIATENDPLGRSVGEPLWPEYFDQQLVTDARRDSDVFQSLYQQEPIPESGNVFQANWLLPYTPETLPSDLFYYVGSDHALGQKQHNDRTCLLPVGVDTAQNIYILPDVFWKKADPLEVDRAIFDLVKRRSPRTWWCSRDHITGSIAPYLTKRMMEEHLYVYIEEIPSQNRRKRELAQAIRARMAMGKVFFPTFASWWPGAKHELLSFDYGKHDDFVDALACVGLGLATMMGPVAAVKTAVKRAGLTLADIKKSHKRRETLTKSRLSGF